MAKPKLTLYYDLHSPYSYLAFWLIRVSSCIHAMMAEPENGLFFKAQAI